MEAAGGFGEWGFWMWAASLLLGGSSQSTAAAAAAAGGWVTGTAVGWRLAPGRRWRHSKQGERVASSYTTMPGQHCSRARLQDQRARQRWTHHQPVASMPQAHTTRAVPSLYNRWLGTEHYSPSRSPLPACPPRSPRRGCDPHPHRQHPPEGWPPRSPPVEEQPAPCSAGGAPAARAALPPVLVLVVLSLLVA